jgi:hypothetical protein
MVDSLVAGRPSEGWAVWYLMGETRCLLHCTLLGSDSEVVPKVDLACAVPKG